jgi:hypothetical protein
VKRKYYGLLSVALILLTLTATAFYAIKISHRMAEEIRTSRIKPFNSISVPDPATIKEIDGLEERVMDLAHPKRSDLSPVNLGLFGYQPMKTPKVMKGERTIILPSYMDYSISLAFSSVTKRFCVIDGAFYTEGSSLPDGGKVVQIEPKRVLISKYRSKEWIPVRERIRQIEKEGKIKRKEKAP